MKIEDTKNGKDEDRGYQKRKGCAASISELRTTERRVVQIRLN
jgi:hypothetical protein